jgi:hypothetical protein
LASFRKNRMVGPFRPDAIPTRLFPRGVQINPIGSVTKPNGKIRPIVHCSAPRKGKSVNSEMIEEWKTVKYTSFLELVKLVKAVGKDGYLWSADAADAYLQLTVRPTDCKYIAVNWLGLVVVFTVLIFGLSSAPRIYTHFADVIEEIAKNKDKRLFTSDELIQLIRHYLDDFFGGHNAKPCTDRQFELFMGVMCTLNVPFNPDKCSPPAQWQKILGFIWDTRSMTVRIPDDKYEAVRKLLLEIRNNPKRKQTKRELLSLIGKLRWCSVAMFAAHAFVRRLEERAHSQKRLTAHIRLNAEARKDIDFWLDGFEALNRGLPLDFILKRASASDITVYSDASGSIGMGAASDKGHFCQMRWKWIWSRLDKIDIFFAELLAIVAFANERAPHWQNQSITFFCDNEAVEWALRKKRCCFKRKDVAALLRHLCALAQRHRFYFWVTRVPTDENSLADALSRFDDEKLDKCKSERQWSKYTMEKRTRNAHIASFCHHFDSYSDLFFK